MFKRNIVVALALLLSSAFASGADALTAFPLHEMPVLLFERPERGAKASEVELSQDGTELTDERRTGDDRWYEATVRGKKGWLFGGELYVVGPADEADEEKLDPLLQHHVQATDDLFEGTGPDGSWTPRPNVRYEGNEDNDPGTIMTWASREAVIQSISTKSNAMQLYLAVNSAAAAERFLGFPALGMTETQLIERLGPETGRRGSVLIWGIAGGEASFEFTTRDGAVVLAEYSFYPGNGVLLPERAFDLRRFRNAPLRNWPRSGWTKGTNVRLRETPSLNAKVAAQIEDEETPLTCLDSRDRGEAYPWYRTEYHPTSGKSAQGWIYGQFLTPYTPDGVPVYLDSFFDAVEYDLGANLEARIKSLGLGKPKNPDAWQEVRPGLVLTYAELQDGNNTERYRAEATISDPRWDFGGVRVGDAADSLEELIEALLAAEWEGEKKLKDGENTIQHPEGFTSLILTLKDGALTSLTWETRAAD